MKETLLSVAKAVLDEDRLRILGCLANAPQTADQLVTRLKLKPAAVQRHLALLASTGLVTAVHADVYALDVRALEALKRELFVQEGRQTTHLTDEERVLAAFVEGQRLKAWPEKPAKLVIVLRWLAEKFELGRRYPEREINKIIQGHHPDYASLRRFLVDYGFMRREQGVYWRVGANSAAEGEVEGGETTSPHCRQTGSAATSNI